MKGRVTRFWFEFRLNFTWFWGFSPTFSHCKSCSFRHGLSAMTSQVKESVGWLRMVPFLNGLDQILFICNNYIHHVRESKTVSDSGLTPWDSGFLKLHYIAKDSGFHNKSFQDSRIRIPLHGLTIMLFRKNDNYKKIQCVQCTFFFLSFLISGNFSFSFLFGYGNVSSWSWNKGKIKITLQKITIIYSWRTVWRSCAFHLVKISGIFGPAVNGTRFVGSSHENSQKKWKI